MSTSPGDPWDPVEVLAEPTRRRLFDAVRGYDEPVTRERVAADVGVSQRLAAFHLDRLADAGLLTVDYARPPGRRGPGAGRPAKRYAPAPVQVDLTVPPRRYNLVARILAAAVARAPGDAVSAAGDVAYEEGRRMAARLAPSRPVRNPSALVREALSEAGFDPKPERGPARLRLRNCPFHDVVDVAPQLVCGLNQRLVTGVLDGLGVSDRCSAQPGGTPPDCCVIVHTG
jgi:predicted ArsR family transcriptional regulator